MFDSSDRDKQGELFSDLPGVGKKTKKLNLNLGKIAVSLSYENLIVFSIALIMVLIVCYSLGVERGKYLALRDTDGSGSIEESSVARAPKKKSPPKGKGASAPATFAKSFFPEADESTPQPVTPRVEVRLETAAEMPHQAAVAEPEPVAKPAPQPVKTAQPVCKYTIQVATFGTVASANKEMDRLKKRGYEPFVIDGINRRGKFSKICVGSYESIADASDDLKKLKKIYGDCFVRNR